MSPGYRYVALHWEPPLARLQIRRPPLNILDIPTLEEMADALSRVEAAEEITLLLLSGEGERAFSAGVEVKDHLPETVAAMLRAFHGLCRRLLGVDRIVVAAVRGYALGGGSELVACCDLVVASENSIFGQPEIDLGCFPPLAAALYPFALGPHRAAEILLIGKHVSAREAHEMGLINRIVPAQDLDRAVDELLLALKEKSPAVLRLTKKALQAGRRGGLAALGEIEKIYLEELARTSDMQEGISAFLEKRKPRWKGR